MNYSHDVNHPSHYTKGNIEVIEFIEDQQLDYHCGNAVKYICRHEHKEAPVKDLQKAIWYLQRKINNIVSPIPSDSGDIDYINYSHVVGEPIDSSMFRDKGQS